MIKISVITPVYNTEPYLRQCLDSLASQILKDMEFICVNDGSTDASLQILQEYAAADTRFRVINQPNGGYGKAINVGIRAARGEYIGFLESDDFAESNMFEVLYQAAIEKRADIVKSNYFIYRDGVSVFHEVLKEYLYEQVFSPFDYWRIFWDSMIWTGLRRRKFLLDNDIWVNETPGASYQDTGFKFKELACAKRVYLLKDAFVHYRMDNAASSINSRQKVYCLCDEYAEIERYLRSRPELPKKYLYVMEALKFDGYRWNLRRISRKYRMEFLQHVVDEFSEADRQGLLDSRYWQKEQWQTVRDMVSNPGKFVYGVYARLCSQSLLASGFKSVTARHETVYIYGAGKVGRETLDFLHRAKIEPSGFLVASMEGNPLQLDGLHVLEASDDSVSREVMILLAITEKNQSSAFSLLTTLGYKHVVPMTDELRESLRVD